MTAVPPKISVSGRVPSANQLGWFTAATLTAAVLGILAVVFFFDPSRNHFYPICQFHRFTGWNCPGCGATRALFALLHGNLSAALHDNALFVLGLLIVALRAGWFYGKKLLPMNNKAKGAGRFWPAGLFLPLLFIAIVFSVLRNLPAFAFLSP